MQLQRLTGLERQKILDELAEVQKLIARLQEILASEKVLLDVIVGELEEVKQLFGDERRTEILGEAADLDVEDLIAEEEMVVTVSHAGYVKRNPVSPLPGAARGGKGKTGAATREEDFLESLFVASTHSYLLVFSDQGKVYWLKVHEIPQAGRAARGKPIVNLVQLAQGEKVAAILPVRELPDPPGGDERRGRRTEGEGEAPAAATYVFAATRRGLIKKTRLEAFARPRAAGIIALAIEEGDELIAARLTDGQSHILLSTAQGMAIRFEESDVRAMGRGAYGVKGITLEEGDEVVSAESLPPAGRGRGRPPPSSPSPPTATASAPSSPSTGSRAAAARASSPSRPPSGTGRWWRPCRSSTPTRSCSSPTAACSSACRRPRSASSAATPRASGSSPWSRARSRWSAWPAWPRTCSVADEAAGPRPRRRGAGRARPGRPAGPGGPEGGEGSPGGEPA